MHMIRIDNPSVWIIVALQKFLKAASIENVITQNKGYFIIANKILPNNKKRGAPGGCVTSNSFEQAINSPQSQKLAVGATVAR